MMDGHDDRWDWLILVLACTMFVLVSGNALGLF